MDAEPRPDRWPPATLTPEQYEQALASVLASARPTLGDWHIEHQERIDAPDGSYIIDVTARFTVTGLAFVVLFECKQHVSPAKREHVQVLHAKVQSTGANKGVMVSTSGFQQGALDYAGAHGIACIRFADEAWTTLRRSLTTVLEERLPGELPRPTGRMVAYQLELTDTGSRTTMISGEPEYIAQAILGQAP